MDEIEFYTIRLYVYCVYYIEYMTNSRTIFQHHPLGAVWVSETRLTRGFRIATRYQHNMVMSRKNPKEEIPSHRPPQRRGTPLTPRAEVRRARLA